MLLRTDEEVAPVAVATLAPTPTPTITPTASPSPTPTPTATPSPTPTPAPTTAPSPTPTTTPVAVFPSDRYTVLVLGSDSDTSRRAQGYGYLTDAITVVSVAADGSNVALFSLPRDTSDIPMPDGSIWTAKANAIAPTLGPGAMRDAMSLLLGIPIDRYAMVDMDDFRYLVDALGGVTVYLPYPISDRFCSIGAGTYHIGGSLALCFARHRLDTDYARADRHQQLLLAIRDRVLAGAANPAALAFSLGSLQTDIGPAEIPGLLDLAVRSSGAEVRRVVFGPEYMTFVGIAGARGWISVPNVAAIQAAVRALAP